MGYKIIFKKRFAKNLFNVLTYLEREWGKKIADEFQDKIDNAIQLIQFHPHIGAPSNKINVRGLLITKHNRLFYKISANTIIILSLADTRKKDFTQ